jgi:hypothetical protein
MSYYDSFYPDVKLMPRLNVDDEIESIDVIIDNLTDIFHCEEFGMNDACEPKLSEKRWDAQRKVALRELTPGMYTESGNKIMKNNRKDAK